MVNDENFMANALLPLAMPKPVLSGRCWDQRKGRCKNTPSVLHKKLMKTPTIEDYLADIVNDTGSEDDIILLDELPQDGLESLASDVHPSGTRRSQRSTSQKLFSVEVSQEPLNIVDASTSKAVKASLTRSSTSMKKLVGIPKNDVKNEVVGFEELSISSTFRNVANIPKQSLEQSTSCKVKNPKNTNNNVEQHQTGSLTPTGSIKKRCKNTPSVLSKKLRKTPTIEDYFADSVNDTDTGSEDDILLDELPQDGLESLASDVHPSGTRRSQRSTSQKLFSEEVSQEPLNIGDAITSKAVKASLTRSSTSMKKLVSIPKNDVKNKVAGFEELPISSTFRDLTNVPKQSCNVMNPKNTNNHVEQHQTGSLTPTGNIRKRLNFEDNPPTPESSAMTTLLKQNGSSTAFSQKSTDEFFNSSMMIQSELLNLKYSAILHAEPCSEDEFVIEEETENNHFSFLPLLGSVHHCHQMSSVSVSSNEHDDSIIQSECTNKKIEQTNTTKHAPKKSGKNSNDLQKAKLTTRSSAIAKPTSLDLKAGIEVEHLPRKKRVTAGDSKVVAAAKSWTTGSTVSVPDNREAPGCAAKKRKKNVSYNNDDKNGSQDDETGLQRKQKSQQMQKSVRSKKLETCVTRSTTARVLSPFEKTCPTQNLIPNNNSLQPSSPPDEPSPSQRKRQVSSYQHLARQASPSKQSKRVPDRLASPSRSSPDRLAKTRRPQGKRKDTELGEKSCVESVRGQSDNSSIPNQRVLQKRARSTVKAGVQKSKGQRKDKEGFNYHPNQKQQKASSSEVFEEEKREEEMYLLSTSSVPMDENTDLESDFNSSVTQSEDTKLEYSTVLQVEPCSEDEFVIMDDTEENNFCISTLPGSLNHCNPLSSSVSVSSNGHDGSIIQRECTNKKAKQANTTKHVPKKSGKNCKSVKKAKLTSVTTRSSAVAKPTSLDLKAGDEIEHLPRKKRVTSGNSNVVADEKSWKTGSTVSVRNNREAPGSAAKKRKKNVSHTDDSKNASQDAVTGLQRKQKSQQLQRPLRSKKLETCVTQSTARVSSPFEETCPTQNLIPNNDSFQPRSPPDQRKRQVSNFQHFAQKERPGELSKRSPDRLAKTRHLQRKRKDTELGENSLVEAICDQSDDNLSTSDQRVLQKRPRSTVKVGVRKSKSQSKSQESFNRIHNQKERKARSAKVFEEQEEEEIYFSSTNSTSMDENRSLESDNDNSSIPDQMVLQKRPRSTVKTGARKPKGQSKNQEVFNHRRSHRQQKASSAKVFEEQQEEEMYLASTSSTSTLDEDHDLESETMLSSPGPSHNPKRPVLPSMTPGMRRSQRLRVPPLEHWRGERIEYVHKSGVFSIQGVISPKIQVKSRKRKSKSEKPTYNGQGFNATAHDMGIPQNEVDLYVNMVKHLNWDTVDPEIGTPVLLPGQTEQVNIDCVRTSEMCLYMGPDRNPLQPFDRLGIWKMFSFSNFSSGLLKLHPLQEKGLQYVKYDTMWFHILQGVLHVIIHQTSYMLKLGDTFFIPAGNVYNIRNVGRTEATLCFVQIKNQVILDE